MDENPYQSPEPEPPTAKAGIAQHPGVLLGAAAFCLWRAGMGISVARQPDMESYWLWVALLAATGLVLGIQGARRLLG